MCRTVAQPIDIVADEVFVSDIDADVHFSDDHVHTETTGVAVIPCAPRMPKALFTLPAIILIFSISRPCDAAIYIFLVHICLLP